MNRWVKQQQHRAASRRNRGLVAAILCTLLPTGLLPAQEEIEPLAEAAPIAKETAVAAPVAEEPATAAPVPPRWERDASQPPYSADPTGQHDATSALRQAIADALEVTRAGGHATLTLPEGTFLLSGTLSLGVDELAARRFHLRGAGPEKTVLRLKDHCGATPSEGDFRDAAQPRPILSYFGANYSEVAIGNTLEDLAIEAGAGNAGAVGVEFHCSLFGAIRNVRIRAGENSGHTGLDLSKRMAGPGVLESVIIQGFARGLVQDDGATFAYGYAAGNLAILNARETSLVSERRLLAVRNLITTGPAPLLKQKNGGGLVHIGKLQETTERPAEVPRYESAGLLNAPDPRPETSDARLVLPKESPTLWEDLTPTVADESATAPNEQAPPEKIVTIPSPGPDMDASALLQAAIDEGATHLILPDAVYVLEKTVTLKTTLRSIRANWSSFIPAGSLLSERGKPVFTLEAGSAPSIVMERIESNGIGNSGFVWIEHISDRELILRDMVLSGGAGAYVGAGKGRVTLENMAYLSAAKPSGEPAWLIQGQTVRALGWTVFADFPHIVNDGGDIEATGLFLGNQHGPYLLNMNGASTRLHGAFAMALRPEGIPPNLPAFVNDNSDLELSLLEHSTSNLGYDHFYETGGHSVLVREFRQGEIRELLKEDAITRSDESLTGSGLARYRSPLREAVPPIHAVTITIPSQREVHEGDTAVARIERSGPLDEALTVHYQMEGDAANSLDLGIEKLDGQVTLKAGEAVHDLALPILIDEEEEADEALILRLTGGSKYRVLYGRHAVRFAVHNLSSESAVGLIARYSFTDGLGTDDTGAGNDAVIHHAKYVSNGAKTALTFNGRGQWVELAPTLIPGEPPPARPVSAAPAPAPPASGPTSLFDEQPAGSPASLDPLEAALASLGPDPIVEAGPPAKGEAPFLHDHFSYRSVVMRFRADDTKKVQTLYEEGGRENGLSLVLRGGDLAFTVAANGELKRVNAAVDPGFWVHVVAVFDAGELRLYLDGRLWNSGRAQFTEIPADNSGAALAATLDGGPDCPAASHYAGLIGDVSIYGKSLKLTEAKELFAGE